MRGAVDEDCLHLARVLQRPPEAVEDVLLEVGVDAQYLSRALLEGDPHGAFQSVSARLGITHRQLALAVVRVTAARAKTTGAPEAALDLEAALHASPVRPREPTTRRMRRAMVRVAAGAVLLALLLVFAASTYVWSPALFAELTFALVATGLLGGAAFLLFLAWRLLRAANFLRRKE